MARIKGVVGGSLKKSGQYARKYRAQLQEDAKRHVAVRCIGCDRETFKSFTRDGLCIRCQGKLGK